MFPLLFALRTYLFQIYAIDASTCTWMKWKMNQRSTKTRTAIERVWNKTHAPRCLSDNTHQSTIFPALPYKPVNSEIKYCYSDKTLSDYFVLHAGFKSVWIIWNPALYRPPTVQFNVCCTNHRTNASIQYLKHRISKRLSSGEYLIISN